MPRNAAKKLNNDEVCLPLATTIKSDSNTQNKTAPLQQTTQLQQRKRRRTKRKGKKRTPTARSTNSAKATTLETVTTIVTTASTVRRKPTPAYATKSSNSKIITTLYPIVIEKSLNLETSATTKITSDQASSTLFTNIGVSDTDAGGVISSSVRVPVGIGGRLRNRRCGIGYIPKRKGKGKGKSKAKPLPPKAFTGQNTSRLATLRTRKVPEDSTKSNENKLKKHAAWYCLDEELLNKIEPLEIEVKKSVSKRKRGSSIVTRKRNSIPKLKVNNSISENIFIGCAEIISSPAITAGCAASDSEILLSVSSATATAAASAPAPALTETLVATPPATSVKKRSRGMSLYERRYQTADDARSAGAVTNGYLSSTRTSSASSSAVHSDADTQDITQQYYIPVAVTPGIVNSTSSVTQLGNGSTFNHAPSMATLCNIGNTCYLNSVVYTLRFAPRFLHNLHHLIVDLSTIQQSIVRQRAKSSSLGRGISAVQLENARSWSSKDLAALEQSALTGMGSGNNFGQKSSYQLLTERLHELYQNLHCNEVAESTEPFHADTLLHAIQDVCSIFEGNQQQDAHEFLMCLLNSIRETCQTLIKAIAECPDLIQNGYIRNLDDADSVGVCALDRDALTPNSNSGGNASPSPVATALSSTSSLSTSNITKASFFSRKSKRKEEAKNSKNSRLQSPLKDAQSGGLQPTSNSLFYLNSVDLSGASSAPSKVNPNTAIIKNITGSASGESGDLSPVNLLKDKERLAERIRELGLDFFSEDFEGVTVSTTKCLSCETVTEQKESMIDIAVPVPISGYDSSDYTEKPSSFIQNSCVTREFFRGENKYRCEQCTGYTEAIRSISFEVLPRLLVIQLSRFSGGMEKISSYIPTAFTLQCFCAKCCELSEANKLHIYKLYSVITHVGATMSVGHYIAYTCSLDWANEYINCPKDRRNQQQSNAQANGLANNGLQLSATSSTQSTQAASAASAAASALASSGSSLMKKMKFVRSKASSSGDMSKNVKNINGITSKTITNGIGKLSMNTTCHSLSCCATRICNVQQQQQQQQLQQQLNSTNDLSEESLQNGSNHNAHLGSASNSSGTSGYSSYPTGYGSTGRGGTKTTYGAYTSSSSGSSTSGEPIWYMCDDDKIKAMTQREFEELLSPARKITVTPYLLFYARFDLQTTHMSSVGKSTTATQAQSWSSENLQSGSGTMASNAASFHKM